MDLILKNRQGILVNTKIVDCDYYRFNENDPDARSKYNGEFMAQYSWAEYVVGYLDSVVRN